MAASGALKTAGGLVAAGAAVFGGQVRHKKLSLSEFVIWSGTSRGQLNQLAACPQAYYQVWTAEQECRVYRRQSADHTRVIQESQVTIGQQEKQTEELFVKRHEQKKV